MNSRRLGAILEAAAACEPSAKLRDARKLVAAAARADAGARWELRVNGTGAASFRPKLIARGAVAGTSSSAFDPSDFPAPVDSALTAFHALAPIREVRRVRGRAGWTLVLASPLPWPRFLRSDLSASFAPNADRLSLVLRDARVAALDFDGETLWARLSG